MVLGCHANFGLAFESDATHSRIRNRSQPSSSFRPPPARVGNIVITNRQGKRLPSVFYGLSPSPAGKALVAAGSGRQPPCAAQSQPGFFQNLTSTVAGWFNIQAVNAQGCGSCSGHYLQSEDGQMCATCVQSTCIAGGYSYDTGCDCYDFRCGETPCHGLHECYN